MHSRFHWITFDLNGILPDGWQQEVLQVAADADFRDFPRTPVLSREAPEVSHISRGRVHAHDVRHRLPWVYQSYRRLFLELAAEAAEQNVLPARDDRYGVVLNVQRGTQMRFECHVDSNPLTGLLFCTDHAGGGELVFAQDAAASSIEDVERDCSVVRPAAGHLIFFDARQHPHYARPLTEKLGMRVVAVMNYYTEACPESTRPRELNRHLYGDELTARRRATGQWVAAIVALPRTVSPSYSTAAWPAATPRASLANWISRLPSLTTAVQW
jgi:hypothetical protein